MPLEEHGRLVEQGVEPVPAPACLLGLGRRLLVFERDVEPLREPLDRADEVDALRFLDEADDVTALAAAKAVIELVDRIDRKARGALVVERTAADEAAALLA